MAVYNYATYSTQTPVTVTRYCDRCASDFSYTKKVKVEVTGRSRGVGADYAGLARARAESMVESGFKRQARYHRENLQRSISEGVLCPQCNEFIRETRQAYFPSGERAEVFKYISGLRKLSVIGLCASIIPGSICWSLYCLDGIRNLQLFLTNHIDNPEALYMMIDIIFIAILIVSPGVLIISCIYLLIIPSGFKKLKLLTNYPIDMCSFFCCQYIAVYVCLCSYCQIPFWKRGKSSNQSRDKDSTNHLCAFSTPRNRNSESP